MGIIYKKPNKNYPLYPCKELFTLKELLSYAVNEHRDKVAFRFEEQNKEVNISYTRFGADVNALGTYLFSQGIKDSHIAIFGENSYEWIVVYFATVCGRNAAVPIDKDLTAEEVKYLIEFSDANAVFYSDTYADVIEGLELSIPCLNMREIPDMIIAGQKLIEGGMTEYINTVPDKNDLASIVFTSGTTGKQKGVMLSHGNFCSCLYGCCRFIKPRDSSVLILPLHHTYGLVTGLFFFLYYGYPVFINLNNRIIAFNIKNQKPQSISAVPLIIDFLYKNIWSTIEKQKKVKRLVFLIKISRILLNAKIDLRKIFFKKILDEFGGNFDAFICGGAPMNQKIIDGMNDFGIGVINGYGITECSPVVATNRQFYMVPDSVGKPLCCNEVKISDEGEILVKGDNVMLGYYKDPVETEKVFLDGWFHTGDLGRIDKNGVLYITGRLKNLIILGNGENIPAEIIEKELYAIPIVKEAIAYGRANTLVAEIYLDEDVPDAKEKIKTYVDELNYRLPFNRNIGELYIRQEPFPKTTTKKIIRK